MTSSVTEPDVHTEYWVCMASKWMVPARQCAEAGTGHRNAQKHTEQTGHATMQTCRRDTADRLLASIL